MSKRASGSSLLQKLLLLLLLLLLDPLGSSLVKSMLRVTQRSQSGVWSDQFKRPPPADFHDHHG